jgi:hypothetical protein
MLKKLSILCALLLAVAFSRPIFADEFGITLSPSGNPSEFLFDYDFTTNSFTSSSPVEWTSGAGELFEFDSLGPSFPGSLPGCAAGPTTDAEIFNCLISTTLTDPSITHQWTISPGAGFSSSNQVADLLLTISDASGTLLIDSGPTLGTGECGPDRTPPCQYTGSSFSGIFTVSSVPEPGSLGLTLLGLGLVAAVSRRRSRSSRVRV